MFVGTINKILFIGYIIIAFCIKYWGLLMPKIEHTNYPHCYKSYKNIAQQNQTENIAGIIIKTRGILELIPVMKKIIGATMIDNKIHFIDSEGTLFQSANENPEEYITVSGDYKYWSKYYEELEKYPKILEKIYHVHIYHYRIDVYLIPGILIQLNRSIKDLNDFYITFPQFFKKKNKKIDLRNTKKVGYSDLNLIKKENNGI